MSLLVPPQGSSDSDLVRRALSGQPGVESAALHAFLPNYSHEFSHFQVGSNLLLFLKPTCLFGKIEISITIFQHGF